MSQLTEKDVLKIAQLSKLELKGEELVKMSGELEKILTFVDTLNKLELNQVEATSHAVQVTNVFRPDEVVKSQVIQEALKGAPSSDGQFFQVPRVIG